MVSRFFLLLIFELLHVGVRCARRYDYDVVGDGNRSRRGGSYYFDSADESDDSSGSDYSDSDPRDRGRRDRYRSRRWRGPEPMAKRVPYYNERSIPLSGSTEIYPETYYNIDQKVTNDIAEPMPIEKVDGPVRDFISENYIDKMPGWSLSARTDGLTNIPIFYVRDQVFHMRCPFSKTAVEFEYLTKPVIDDNMWERFDINIRNLAFEELSKYRRYPIHDTGVSFRVRLRHLAACPLLIDGDTYQQFNSMFRVVYAQFFPFDYRNKRYIKMYKKPEELAVFPLFFEGTTPWKSGGKSTADVETSIVRDYWHKVNQNYRKQENEQPIRIRKNDVKPNGEFKNWCSEKDVLQKKAEINRVYQFVCGVLPIDAKGLFDDEIFKMACGPSFYPVDTVFIMGTNKLEWSEMTCEQSGKWKTSRISKDGSTRFNECRGKSAPQKLSLSLFSFPSK